ERLQKLKQMVDAEDTATDLDLKMIAVIVKADQPELFNILRTIYHGFTEQGDNIGLDTTPAAWDQLEKFDLAEPFWQMVNRSFGYVEENPTLKNLLIRLLVSDYAYNLKVEIPTALVHLVLPPMGRSNAVVFQAQWRDSHTRRNSYDRLSEEIASL